VAQVVVVVPQIHQVLATRRRQVLRRETVVVQVADSLETTMPVVVAVAQVQQEV
jgi:hypothetical protein